MVIGRHQVPAGPAAPGRFTDLAIERLDAPRDLRVGHECSVWGGDVRGERSREFLTIEEQEPVLVGGRPGAWIALALGHPRAPVAKPADAGPPGSPRSTNAWPCTATSSNNDLRRLCSSSLSSKGAASSRAVASMSGRKYCLPFGFVKYAVAWWAHAPIH